MKLKLVKGMMHVDKDGSCSSDSSDSEDERLKEAVIDVRKQFGADKRLDMTYEKPTIMPKSRISMSLPGWQRTTPSTVCKKFSLRSRDEDAEASHELDTTPEFRAHVAKKLSQVIEESIENVDNLLSISQDTDSSAEIKIFSTSVLGVETPVMKRKRKVSSSSSDSDEEDRLAAASVTGHFILNQGEQLRREDATKFQDTPTLDHVTIIKKKKKHKKKDRSLNS